MIIVFEGLHGCGKSTQMNKLKLWIEENTSYEVKSTKWNSYPVLSDFCDYMKLNKAFSSFTFSLISALDFNLRYDELIKYKTKNEIILFDRYIYTAYVRDLIRSIPKELLDSLYKNIIKPDIIFYFDIDPKTSISRMGNKVNSRSSYILGDDLNLDEDPIKNFELYLNYQREKYESILEKDKDIFFKIDAFEAEDVQFRKILYILDDCLNIKNK